MLLCHYFRSFPGKGHSFRLVKHGHLQLFLGCLSLPFTLMGNSPLACIHTCFISKLFLHSMMETGSMEDSLVLLTWFCQTMSTWEHFMTVWWVSSFITYTGHFSCCNCHGGQNSPCWFPRCRGEGVGCMMSGTRRCSSLDKTTPRCGIKISLMVSTPC